VKRTTRRKIRVEEFHCVPRLRHLLLLALALHRLAVAHGDDG